MASVPEKNETYAPLHSPPYLSLAEKHAEANCVGAIKRLDQPDICECCGVQCNKSELALWCSTRDFNYIGSGYVLWFSSTIYVAIMMFLCFWMSYHKVISNSQTDHCLSTTDSLHPCVEDWIHKYSIANYGRDFDSTYVWTHVVYIIFLYMGCALFKNKLVNEHKVIDIETDTAADFTIMVSLLPSTATEADIRVFFEREFDGVHTKVHTVSMTYDIDILSKLLKEKENISNHLTEAISEYRNRESEAAPKHIDWSQEVNGQIKNKGMMSPDILEVKDDNQHLKDPEVKRLNDELNEKKREVREERQRIKDNHSEYFTGIAYVSFEKMEHADKWVNAYMRSGTGWFFKGCRYPLRYPDMSKHSKRIRIQPAPESDEIIWHNLKYKFRDQLKWKILTGIIVTIVLLITFGIIFGIKYGKYKIKKSYYGQIITETNAKGEHVERYEHEITQDEKGILNLIAILIFVVAKITNKIFDHIVTDLTVLEKDYSVGVFYTSAVAKTVVSQFVNTSVLIMIVHVILHSQHDRYVIWGFGSLLVDIWYLLIFNAAIVPGLHLINFSWIGKLFKRCKLRRSVANKSKTYTQKEAHTIIEGPTMSAVKCYTDTYQLFLTGLFFQPVFPLSTGILCISQLLNYWIEKFYLLRVYSLPKLVQDRVALESLVFMKVGGFVLSASHMYFDVIMSEDQKYPHPLTIVMTCITFCLIFVPIEDAFLHAYTYTGDEAEIKKYETYQSICLNFQTDYNRSNPVTKDEFLRAQIHLAAVKDGGGLFHSPLKSTKNKVGHLGSIQRSSIDEENYKFNGEHSGNNGIELHNINY